MCHFQEKNLYEELDMAFPNSKFILTVRDNKQEWFNSVVKFETKKFSSNSNRLPNEIVLKNSCYSYKVMMFNNKKIFYNYPDFPLYDRKEYIEKLLLHN